MAAETNKRKPAAAAHTVVNSLSVDDIMFLIADMKRVFDPNEPARKGRKRHAQPTSVEFRIRVDPSGADIWLNPRAFSWTKQKRAGTGYPTMSFRRQRAARRQNLQTRKLRVLLES
jgi:hypothetical protein